MADRVAALILAVGTITLVALIGYCFGWYWRGRYHRTVRRTTITSRPLTDQERRDFDLAFKHMDNAFKAVDRIFGGQ